MPAPACPPYAITRIEDYTGKTVYEHRPPAGEPVIRPEHAYLINSILSDNTARTPAFGPNSPLNLPFPAAAKTGTSNDFRATGPWAGRPTWQWACGSATPTPPSRR